MTVTDVAHQPVYYDPYDVELRQLTLNYGHSPEVDARALRRRLAELEYDDEG